MYITEGSISAIKQRPNNYSICVNGSWYNDLGECRVKKGNTIKLSFDLQNFYKKINKIFFCHQTSPFGEVSIPSQIKGGRN